MFLKDFSELHNLCLCWPVLVLLEQRLHHLYESVPRGPVERVSPGVVGAVCACACADQGAGHAGGAGHRRVVQGRHSELVLAVGVRVAIEEGLQGNKNMVQQFSRQMKTFLKLWKMSGVSVASFLLLSICFNIYSVVKQIGYKFKTITIFTIFVQSASKLEYSCCCYCCRCCCRSSIVVAKI